MHNYRLFFLHSVGIHVYCPSNANDLKTIYNLHNFSIFPSFAFLTVLFVLYLYDFNIGYRKKYRKEGSL